MRGVWDKHGDKVSPDVPQAIAAWPKNEPRNRLGLARWIVSRDNPLTARVVVNHVWQMLFGVGLVKTQEDFGLQGEIPLHGELLDWLAVDLIEHNWDIKHLIRLIVSSRVYQQSSASTEDAWAADPENRWLARGPRFRLPSWMLRDAALQTAGLLNPSIGGPPVRPYQPDGVWEELFMGRFNYEPSEGRSQYRRTLYAFWRRSIAPTFLFDSAQRRTCEVRVGRTNTPLQALTLLNDETYLEAARQLAIESAKEPTTLEVAIRAIGSRVLTRKLLDEEVRVLLTSANKAYDYYAQHEKEAQSMISLGRSSAIATHEQPTDDAPRVAALMTVASMLMNLDEAITHE